eukprot:scaffold4659_cov125-Isochrysis_galbana.AAC.1
MAEARAHMAANIATTVAACRGTGRVLIPDGDGRLRPSPIPRTMPAGSEVFSTIEGARLTRTGMWTTASGVAIPPAESTPWTKYAGPACSADAGARIVKTARHRNAAITPRRRLRVILTEPLNNPTGH